MLLFNHLFHVFQDHQTSAQALLEISSHIQEQGISFSTLNEECEPSMSGRLYPYNSQRLPTNSTRPVGFELKEYSFIQQCRPPTTKTSSGKSSNFDDTGRLGDVFVESGLEDDVSILSSSSRFVTRPQTKSRQMLTVVDGTHLPTVSCKKPKKETLEFFPMNTEEKYTLIDAVRFYPELWDDRHPNFKDTTKRSQAWNFVIVEMQESHGKDFKEEVLARSFKNLKDTYRRKMKEINDLNRKAIGSEASESVEKIKAWPFFDYMSFLDVILDRGPRFSSVCKTEEDVIVDFEESPSTSASSSRSRTPQSGNGSGGPERARKVPPRRRPGRNMDGIASAIKSLNDSSEKMDPTKISGMKLAMTLSEMREKKPMEYVKWTIKTDEFMLEMSRALHDC
ncbi:unnamed protein product [Nippostrongylus brasiliensis]|uniref:MADF domain-containing protein n=1 Tax=Nippostrongylus brasiliensis TaxID=27835 RepID=A0A0N4YTL0_NIPBR|nr:unnamed protein product [Nippostrongylus brasiliensis]